ncbi:MAG TPA: hypothetical protein VHX42_03345 [Candidatus Babeliales bacterium]|nr:hypothetical protein [Candidatus Babeliales bacterium]
MYADEYSHLEDSIKDFDFDFDMVSFDDDDYQLMEYLDTAGMDHISRAINPVDIINFLNLFGVPAILQEPIFLHTNVLNKRSLLDQPIFEPDRAEFPGSFVVGFHAFGHKIERSNFTKHSTKLASYLALTEASLITKLQNVIDMINNLPVGGMTADIAEVFSLFENMTVEERQIGFMFHCMKRWHKTTFRLMIPIYYLQSNFSLTQKEQDEAEEVLNPIFGARTQEEADIFNKAHFISDKIGFGDTRIEVDNITLKRPRYTIRCGGFVTLPTAWTWGGGFMGSQFPKPSTLPTFELEPLIESITSNVDEAKAVLANFVLDSFDRVAANLLDVPLGNNHHFGFGGYMRWKLPLRHFISTTFADRMHFAGRTSLELFLPSSEKRFYINKINEQAFADRNFNDTENAEVAADNLQFLKEQIISRLFLRAFDTRIIPGVIFRWSGGLYYKGQQWGFNVGPDFWLQNKPHFSKIYAPCNTLQMLDIPKVKQSIAYQGKAFGGVVLKHKSERSTWFFSLNGDISLFERGLGKDYTLSLNFEASF